MNIPLNPNQSKNIDGNNKKMGQQILALDGIVLIPEIFFFILIHLSDYL